MNQGQVYEAFNMAALWQLPVIYVIENNEYSMGTSVARSTAMTDLYKKGESFGIPGVQVNGMDVEEVYDTTMEAIESVRAGGGPMIIEVKTYRYRGHSMSDPAKYRGKEEVDQYKKKDPIIVTREKLLKSGTKEDVLKKTEKEVKEQIAEVEAFAADSPLPDESELYTDIFK